MRTYFVEFVDSDTHTVFHSDTYTSLKAVGDLVTMWGNCYTIITDLTDAENEGEPVSARWVMMEAAKAIALPMTIILGSLWVYWHKAEIVVWMTYLTH